jgi:hypothetical protein
MNEALAARRTLTTTERNWLVSVAIVGGALAFFAVIYLIELRIGRWNSDIRLVRNPAHAAMRYLGTAHFLVAFFYMLTSRQMRSMAMQVRLAIGVLIAVALCVVYSRLQSVLPVAAIAMFIGYFMVHDFRDQVYFFFANGDGPGEGDKRLRSMLFGLPLLAVSLVFLIAATVATRFHLGVFESDALVVVSAIFVVVSIAAVIRGWRARASRGTIDYRPLIIVFTGTAAVLASSVAMKVEGHVIVTLHVATWYVFTLQQLRERPAAAAGLLDRLRNTTAGFNLLHVGTAIVLLIAGGIWAYAFRNDPSSRGFWILLDRHNFYLWTIAHVTISFATSR